MKFLQILILTTAFMALPWGREISAAIPVRLEECVDSALVCNPTVRAAALEAGKARMLKGTAFDPPMTEITLKQETTGGGGPENGVYFGQEFDFPTAYIYRHKALSAEALLKESRLMITAAEVEKQVRETFFDLLYYQRLLQLNLQLDSIYEEFCRVAKIRLEEGESSALELMNAERVRENNLMERRELEANYDSRQLDLRALTGMDGELIPIWNDEELLSIIPPFNFSSTLRGKAAERELALAERQVEVARGEFLPGIRIGGTVQALIKSFNPYNVERLPFEKGNFMGFEVGVTVPLFFGAKTSRLKAAEADRQISRLNMEAAEVEAAKEAETAACRLSNLAERLEYYRQTAVPRADEIRRLALVSYSFGDIDYMEYIANLETAFGIYRDQAGCLNDYRQAAVALENLMKE